MERHHRWMLLACLLCLVLAATLSGSAGYTGLVGILFAVLMVGCCVLPMLLVLFGKGREGGHSCHGGPAKEAGVTPSPRNDDAAGS
jgi:hypothetical protein